jgi:hypothetical protein
LRLKYSKVSLIDLQGLPLKDRAAVAAMLKGLKSGPFPNGIFDSFEISSGPVDIFEAVVPPIFRVKTEDPKTWYRVLYFVDKPHGVVCVATIRPRSTAYSESPIYHALIEGIVRDYFNEEGWKYECH